MNQFIKKLFLLIFLLAVQGASVPEQPNDGIAYI